MEGEQMDLQKLSFFTEGNTFSGSRTKDWNKKNLLRYQVRPDLENRKLTAFAWTSDLCFEAAPEKREKEFSLDDSGLSEIQNWLLQQYQDL